MVKTQHRHFDDDMEESMDASHAPSLYDGPVASSSSSSLSSSMRVAKDKDEEYSSKKKIGGKKGSRGGGVVHAIQENSDGGDDDDYDDSDDNAAPEAVQSSKAKAQERQRLSKTDNINKASKQARRNKGVSLKSQKKMKKNALGDVKGKGREEEVGDEPELEDDGEDHDHDDVDVERQPEVVPAAVPRKSASHRTFDDDDDDDDNGEEGDGGTTASATIPTRLDPALFKQADRALESARRQAALDKKRELLLALEAEENGLTAGGGGAANKRKQRNPTLETKSKVIGDTTVQQLQPLSINKKAAAVDPSTALTSQRSEMFLRDRLYKRKRARLNKTSTGGQKSRQEDRPHLLFDPLLDKPKAKQASKGLTRAELEERLRFRKPAQQAYLKSRKTLAPSLTFAAPSRVGGNRR